MYRYRLLLPLPRHPLVQAAEDMDGDRWKLRAEGELPPEIAFALAGPGRATAPDPNDLDQLSLNEPLQQTKPRIPMANVI